MILHAPNCRTLKESRNLCCRVLGFHRSVTSENSTYTPRYSTLTLRFFVSAFSGTIFPGTIFPRDHFSRYHFSCTIFPGTVFPGDQFSGDHLSGIHFTTKSWELLYILSCPIAITCEKRVFFNNTKNNNNNLIKKAFGFSQRTCNVQLTMHFTEYIY